MGGGWMGRCEAGDVDLKNAHICSKRRTAQGDEWVRREDVARRRRKGCRETRTWRCQHALLRIHFSKWNCRYLRMGKEGRWKNRPRLEEGSKRYKFSTDCSPVTHVGQLLDRPKASPPDHCISASRIPRIASKDPKVKKKEKPLFIKRNHSPRKRDNPNFKKQPLTPIKLYIKDNNQWTWKKNLQAALEKRLKKNTKMILIKSIRKKKLESIHQIHSTNFYKTLKRVSGRGGEGGGGKSLFEPVI